MNKLKKVDYECLVGSQVLMEFEDNESLVSKPFKSVGFLCGIHKIADFFLYAEVNTDHAFDNCRIYQHPDYWISNAKGDLVLPEGLLINTHRRNGSIDIMLPTEDRPMAHIADYLRFDIMSVQVVRAAEGYEL